MAVCGMYVTFSHEECTAAAASQASQFQVRDSLGIPCNQPFIEILVKQQPALLAAWLSAE